MSEQLESIRKKYEDYEDKGYDKSYEDDWKQMLNDLNNLKIKVYKEKMFSDNEEFQDVKTEEIKFMLIAFLQSEIIQKFQTNRKNILEFALKFYDEFFKLLQTYNYLSKDQIKKYKYLTEKNEEGKLPEKKSFEQMSFERQDKIAMYKYKKELSEKIKQIEKEKKYDDNREYWQDYLNLCIVKMYDNLKMINMELESISYLEKMKKEKPEELNKKKEPNKNEKMEILQIKSPEDLFNLDPNNKLVQQLNFVNNIGDNFQFFNINNLQTLDSQILAQLPVHIREKVFRNPNPTEMTMEEFAEIQEKRMKEEAEKAKEHEKNKSDSDSDKEDVDDKKKKKAREWDDWKDAHPKGSGNRMGK